MGILSDMLVKQLGYNSLDYQEIKI